MILLLQDLVLSSSLSLLEAFAAKLDAREAAIAAHLREKPSTLAELVEHRFLYPRSHQDIYIDDVERRTIEQHLAALVAAGRVAEGDGRFRELR